MLQYRSIIQNHHKIVHIHHPFIVHSSLFIVTYVILSNQRINHWFEDFVNPKKVYLRGRFKLFTNNLKKNGITRTSSPGKS